MKSVQCLKGISFLDVYRKKMEQIVLLRQYLDEPKVFNFGSPEFKEFLIHSFSNLHKDFHYLSFVNKDDIDQELVKVSEILQIMPGNHLKKKCKFFEDWSESEIHKFWMRFFSLFHINEVNEYYNRDYSFAFESKISFLKDINSALHYLNYDFPIINLKKTMQVNIDEEIKNWVNDEICAQNRYFTDSDTEADTLNDSTISDCDEKLLFNINTENVITDLKHVLVTDNNIKKVKQECKPDDVKSLTVLINLIKEVLMYANNLNLIDYKILSEGFEKCSESINENDFMNNLHFLQRYNNLINVLKSKMKFLNQKQNFFLHNML